MKEEGNKDFISVGQKLKLLREAKAKEENTKISIRELALRLDVDHNHVWELENDKSDWKQSSLSRILAYYKILPEDFFKGVKF